MLSKCANPECSEVFRSPHPGEASCLCPTLNLQSDDGKRGPLCPPRNGGMYDGHRIEQRSTDY